MEKHQKIALLIFLAVVAIIYQRDGIVIEHLHQWQ
jgi:hypothetical protein